MSAHDVEKMDSKLALLFATIAKFTRRQEQAI
jgi:hypothetical protein